AALGAAAYHVDRRRRTIARANLAHAFPEKSAAERERIVAACFRHFGAAFVDALSTLRLDLVELCRRTTVTGLEHVVAAEERAKGVIFLTAHFGNWEIAPTTVVRASGPVASVARPPDNPHVAKFAERLRTRFGNRLLDKRGAVREMFRLLHAGGRLGLLLDQRVRASEAIAVPFFGRPAWTSPIAARLAARTGAAVVPCFGDHRPLGRYAVEFHPALVADASDSPEATLEFTTRCLAVCERAIRAAPEKWLWLHDRWKR
ncbi:MAG: lysophospholipid acyltransferase family protein, partial [Myxococcota bacterium]